MMLGEAAGAAIGYTIGTTAHDLATTVSGSSPKIAENATMRPSAATLRAPEIPSGSIDESKLLDTAQQWLGEGAKEVKPGRWVSQDGLRQFRFGSHETKNPENIHAHFEAYDRPATDGGRLTENAVVKVELNKWMQTPSEAKRICTVKIAGNGAPTLATRHTVNGVEIPKVSSLVIATYGDGDYYLLYLDAKGSELTDTCHDSIEAAKSQAEFEYGIAPDRWVKN
jgi:hypothetical protein